MLAIEAPGYGNLSLEHLVLDLNGTCAIDGTLIEGIRSRIEMLAHKLEIHVLTADTRGTAHATLAGWPVTPVIIAPGREDHRKGEFIERLGAAKTAAVGNGRNDAHMLQGCILGIAVLQAEGLAREALLSADVLCPDIASALDLLIHPQRLIATLRL